MKTWNQLFIRQGFILEEKVRMSLFAQTREKKTSSFIDKFGRSECRLYVL